MHNPTIYRYYGYEAVVEIDAQTYEITSTDDSQGYAFQFDDARGQLRSLLKSRLEDVEYGRADAVDIQPGYLRARVAVDGGGEPTRSPRPKEILAAVAGVAGDWNKRHARPSQRGGYLDGLQVGDRYIEAVPLPDAPTPEAWISNRSNGDEDAVPLDSDVVAVIEDGEPAEWDADRDRYVPVTAVWPIKPETYDPVENPDQFDDTVTAFEWADRDIDQLRQYVTNGGRWGGDFRLTIAPNYLQVETATRSLSQQPARYVLRDLGPDVERFNRRRPVDAVSKERELRRPELQLGDEMYIGVASGGSHAGEWIAARDLGDIDGETFAPAPESDGEDVAPDESSGGVLSRLGGE